MYAGALYACLMPPMYARELYGFSETGITFLRCHVGVGCWTQSLWKRNHCSNQWAISVYHVLTIKEAVESAGRGFCWLSHPLFIGQDSWWLPRSFLHGCAVAWGKVRWAYCTRWVQRDCCHKHWVFRGPKSESRGPCCWVKGVMGHRDHLGPAKDGKWGDMLKTHPTMAWTWLYFT